MLTSNYFDLYLIRHGQTDINLSNQIGQDRHSPLNATGIKQAELLRDYFKSKNIKFDKVYSSTYDRAYHTAKIIQNTFDIIQIEDLKEYSAGDWKGLERPKTFTPDILFKMNSLTTIFQPPNGEALNQVQRRASKWLDEELVYNQELIKETNHRKQNKQIKYKIAAVSHGMTIKSLLGYIMGFDKSFTHKISIYNTSISHLSFGDYGWKLHYLNNCPHLQ